MERKQLKQNTRERSYNGISERKRSGIGKTKQRVIQETKKKGRKLFCEVYNGEREKKGGIVVCVLL